MIVTKEHVGDIVCEYDNGTRFVVNGVSDHKVFLQRETGEFACITDQFCGAVESDSDRVESFRNNLSLVQALNAAETAAHRHQLSPCLGIEALADDTQVLDFVSAQRRAFHARLEQEAAARKAGVSLAGQFLHDLSAAGPGAHGTFFGVEVRHLGNNRQEEPFYDISGFCKHNTSAAVSLLSELTPKSSFSRHSIDDKIASALDRAKQREEGKTSNSRDR